MSGTFSIERIVRVYDDAEGDFYEVRPDTDGHGLVEVLLGNARNDAYDSILVLPPAMALLLAQALNEVAGSAQAEATVRGQP